VSGLIITHSHKLAADGGKMVDKIEQGYKNLQITEITGFDGRDQELEAITVDVKTFGKGTPLDLSDLSLSIGEEDFRTILRYRANGELTPGNDGYNTWVTEEFENLVNFETVTDFDGALEIVDGVGTSYADIDGDTILDTVAIAGGAACGLYSTTHICFELSSSNEIIYIRLVNSSNDEPVDINGVGVPFDIELEPIVGADGTDYGFFSMTGVSDGSAQIGASDSGNVVGAYYVQPELIDTDLDDDGLDDYVAINNTHAIFFISGLSHTIPISLGVDLGTAPQTLDVEERVTNGARYATVHITGTTNTVGELDSGVIFELDPYYSGSGYYTIDYLKRGENPMDGYIVPGDLIRFYAETYRSIGINEIIRVQFYYKDLDSAMKFAYTGDTMPEKERIILFPRI
jgi:hypothetical protein